VAGAGAAATTGVEAETGGILLRSAPYSTVKTILLLRTVSGQVHNGCLIPQGT
jgi:hypothetical protein